MSRVTTTKHYRPITTIAVLAGIMTFLLFILGYDQGHLFSIVLGEQAYADNYLHELFHDTRHTLGFPCH